MNQSTENMNNSPEMVNLELHVANLTSTPVGYDTHWRTLPCGMCCSYQKNDLSGSREDAVVVELYSKETFTIPCGDGLFIPAGVRHRIVTVGSQMSSVWAHFSCTNNCGLELSSLYRFPMRLGFDQNIEAIGTVLHRLAAIDKSTSPAKHYLASLECGALIALLMQSCDFSAQLREDDSKRLRPALLELCRPSGQNATIRHLAELCYLSESRFRYLFHTATGLSPSKFKERERIRAACRMLWADELSLVQIADQLGYCDVFHFSRAFRKATGIPPTRYRKSISPSPA